MKSVTSTDYVRQNLAISQKDFADFLGISRSLLSMFENGLRNLATPELIKIAHLETAYYELQKGKSKTKNNNPVHKDIQKYNEKTRERMQLHAQFCKLKSDTQQQKLNQMIIEQNKLILLQQVLENILINNTAEKIDKMDITWIQIQQRKMVKKMIRYGDAAQAKLQAKITAWEAEEHVYKELLEKIN